MRRPVKKRFRYMWGTVLLSMCVSSIGCARSMSVETYFIPQGYVGPIVILFDQSDGVTVQPENDGGMTFRIPLDGILHVRNVAPGSGIYVRRFLVDDGSKGMRELPQDTIDTEYQVFGYVVGGTGMIDRGPTGDIRWIAFLVGTRVELDNWVDLRKTAIREAVRAVMSRKFPDYPFEDAIPARERNDSPIG